MAKFYRVDLYKCIPNTGIKNVGKIVVDGGIFVAHEIVTDQWFRIYPNTSVVGGMGFNKSIKENGFYYFVIESDINPRNILKQEEIPEYVENFKNGYCAFRDLLVKKGKAKVKK